MILQLSGMTRKSYNSIVSQLHGTFLYVASTKTKQAAEEVKMKEGTADIAGSFNGSWQNQEFLLSM